MPSKNLSQEEISASRLFAIDAGLDTDLLRSKYTDQTKYILMKGIVGVRVKDNDSDSSSPTGYIKSLSNPNVYVPLPHHALLKFAMEAEASRNRNYDPPRYQATLNIGQRLEPWLIDIKDIESE